MNNTFSVLDFGAKAGIDKLQTKEIQAAIDHCFLSGGGTVEIPEGVFSIGGIRLRSNVTLHLLKNAVLKASRNPEDYYGYKTDTVEPLDASLITDAVWKRAEVSENKDEDYKFIRTAGSRWNNAIIRGINAENIAIIGEEGSVIDGSDCYDEKGEENYRGPHAISMFYCKNITFKGYQVKNSANWAHNTTFCENITAENLTVLAGHDGIHLTSCNNVKISNCKFYTGDDCVSGFANYNVTVLDCVLNSSCSAFRMGGTNILVERCNIYGPGKYFFRGSLSDEEKKNPDAKPKASRNNMLSAFTYYSDFSFEIPRLPENIVIRDTKIDFADQLLHFNYSGNEWWQQNRPLKSMRFENVEATNISMPLVAYGDEKIPITLELENMKMSMRKGFEKTSVMHTCNYEKILIKNIEIENFQGEALIESWSQTGEIEISNVKCNLNKDDFIMQAEKPFQCDPI